MRERLLVRHFLAQFVENEFTPDIDRHQALALAAAGVITVPLFITIFMGWRYLLRPLQAPGWTEITMLDDEMLFCSASMLVSAFIAALEWDALALGRRDAMILGVMPIPRGEVVRAKALSLVLFAAAFVGALNLLPAVLHPPLMVANLPLNPVWLVPLIAARGLSTGLAGAFGFACVVAARALLYAALGRRRFDACSDVVRSALLFVLLVLVALLPARFAGGSDSMLRPGSGTFVQRPVSWFAAADATIASSILGRLPQPDMPAWMASEEQQLRTRFDEGLPRLHALAATGLAALASLLAAACGLSLWNARRVHLLPEHSAGGAILRLSRVMTAVSRLAGGRPARRAGTAFLFRTAFDNPGHRLYLIVSAAAAIAVWNATAPASMSGGLATIPTTELAAQTLVLTAIVSGFRAVLRTSADERAVWTFAVADTGQLAAYRAGVRLAVLGVAITVVAALIPMDAQAWGLPLALRHAANGAALACMLVEFTCGSVDRPLVATIPPNDALNTVGVVFLGALVILVFVLAAVERAALASNRGTAIFAAALIVAAVWGRRAHARSASAAILASVDERRMGE